MTSQKKPAPDSRQRATRGLTPTKEGLMNNIVPGPPDIQTVDGPNPWADVSETALLGHSCYFCNPANYPPMPTYHTLCARCSQLISTAPVIDVMNDSMFVCEKCERELAASN